MKWDPTDVQSRKEGSRFRTLMAAQLLVEKGSVGESQPKEGGRSEDEVVGEGNRVAVQEEARR